MSFLQREGGPHLIGATAPDFVEGERPSAGLPWPGLAGLIAGIVSVLLRLEAAEPGTPLDNAADLVHLFFPELLGLEVDIYFSRISAYWALLTFAWYGAVWSALYYGWRDGVAALRRWQGSRGDVREPDPRYAPVRSPVAHEHAAFSGPRAGAWELGGAVEARWDHLGSGVSASCTLLGHLSGSYEIHIDACPILLRRCPLSPNDSHYTGRSRSCRCGSSSRSCSAAAAVAAATTAAAAGNARERERKREREREENLGDSK